MKKPDNVVSITGEPYRSPYNRCPVDYSPLRIATGRLTLALWALFLVLFICPYVIAAFGE